jgi:uncharacterized RDD family membrane protein YckC
MDQIDFSNSFNVTLRLQLAGHGKRIAAFLIDWLMMASYYAAAAFFIEYNFSFMDEVLLPLALLPVMFYHVLFEVLFAGQTLGKMLLHIKVTQLDGSPVSLGSCLLRWMFLLVDFWVSGTMGLPGLVGLISMSVSKQKQRLGDRVAGTVVINTRIKSRLDLYEPFYEFDSSYAPAYPQAAVLSEAQVAFIISVLIAADGKTSYDTDLRIIAGKVCTILQLDRESLAGIGAKQLLREVARSYNYGVLRGV